MRYNNKEFRALYSLVNHLAQVGPAHYNHNIVAAICCSQRDKARATTAEYKRVKDGQPVSKAEAAAAEVLAARPKPQHDWFAEATELARESAAEVLRNRGVVPPWAEQPEVF